MTTRVKLNKSPRAVADARDEWNALAGDVPFRRWEWLGAWWNAYRADSELFVLEVRQGPTLIGALPLFRSRVRGRGWTLRLLGSGEVCTDYVSLLCRKEQIPEVAEAAAEWLTQQAAANDPDTLWEYCELDNVPDSDDAIRHLTDALADRQNAVERLPAHRCWAIPLPASESEFLKRLSKNHRKRVRRMKNRLEQDSQLVLRSVQTPDDFAQGFAVLVDLHQHRWEAKGQPGCFRSGPFARFLEEALERLLANNALDLWWLESDGQPIAVQVDCLSRDAAYSYQSGVDVSASALSPGHMLQFALLQRAIAQGRTRYDFLRGSEPYKLSWRAVPETCHTVRVVPPRLLAQARNQMWRVGGAVKRWLRGRLIASGWRKPKHGAEEG